MKQHSDTKKYKNIKKEQEITNNYKTLKTCIIKQLSPHAHNKEDIMLAESLCLWLLSFYLVFVCTAKEQL